MCAAVEKVALAQSLASYLTAGRLPPMSAMPYAPRAEEFLLSLTSVCHELNRWVRRFFVAVPHHPRTAVTCEQRAACRTRGRRGSAMQKLRIGRLGFGAERRKRSLNERQIPNFRVRNPQRSPPVPSLQVRRGARQRGTVRGHAGVC
jgi:hypothetical protein